MVTPQQFWMVYGAGQRDPTCKHASRMDAFREAKRLARMNPEIEFFVLEAIDMVVKRELIEFHFRADEHDQDIPF